MFKPVKIKDKEIAIPIIQGGMGVGVSRSSLVSAVINEGGMGTLSFAQLAYDHEDFFVNVRLNDQANYEMIKKDVKKVRELTNNKGFLAVNILTASRDYNNIVKTAVDAKVDAIVSGAGLPINLPEFTKGTDTAAIPIVANSRVLNIIVKRWEKRYGVLPDAVIVEGPLAGGHLGISYEDVESHDANAIPLEERFLDVKNYCQEKGYDFPIFVAGGIFSNEDVVRFKELGADGVQLGTRFIATEECDANINFKEKFVNSTKEDVVYVKSPVGYPARALKNNFTEKLAEGHIKPEKCIRCVSPCKGIDDSTPYCISEYLAKSVKGDAENGLVFTGANGYRITEITTVPKLFKELLGEE